jgi:hypothetical protein
MVEHYKLQIAPTGNNKYNYCLIEVVTPSTQCRYGAGIRISVNGTNDFHFNGAKPALILTGGTSNRPDYSGSRNHKC